jgi:hypothetical protein
MGNLFEKFKRTDSSEGELREAAKVQGPVDEPSSFWSRIANDASMPVVHRRLALIQLFRRHVIPGRTSIGELARILDGAHWLGDDDITVITALGGKVPVKWSPDGTVIAIALPGGRGAIYLALAGRFAAEELLIALRGFSHDQRVLSAVIREVAIEEHT